MNTNEILQSSFVTVPVLQIEERGEEVVVSNTAVGTQATFTREILAVLDFFKTPRPLSHWLKQPSASRDTLVRAVSQAMISDVNRLMGAAREPIGRSRLLSAFLEEDRSGTTALFGAPVDMASTGRGGARRGPSEIRHHFKAPLWGSTEGDYTDGGAALARGPGRVYLDFEMRRQYSGSVPDVQDLGDVVSLPGEAISTYGPRVATVANLILEKGGIPAMLGGDHSCTAFAIKPHLERHEALGIIHFDAHHDIWAPPAPQYSYVTHANALYGALQSDNMIHMLQLGLRVFDAAMISQLQDDKRLNYFSARELHKMHPKDVFSGLADDIPYYLTFDIDCMDPQVAPETGTPLPGGLGYYQALDLVDYAARNFNIVGWDIVEVSQREQAVNGAATCAARVARQLMLGDMNYEPLVNYARRI